MTDQHGPSVASAGAGTGLRCYVHHLTPPPATPLGNLRSQRYVSRSSGAGVLDRVSVASQQPITPEWGPSRGELKFPYTQALSLAGMGMPGSGRAVELSAMEKSTSAWPAGRLWPGKAAWLPEQPWRSIPARIVSARVIAQLQDLAFC